MPEYVTIMSRDRNVNIIKNSQSNQFTVTLSIMLWVTVPLHKQQRKYKEIAYYQYTEYKHLSSYA